MSQAQKYISSKLCLSLVYLFYKGLLKPLYFEGSQAKLHYYIEKKINTILAISWSEFTLESLPLKVSTMVQLGRVNLRYISTQ